MEKTNVEFNNFVLFEKFDIKLSDIQKSQLKHYYEILVSENEKYNLTAITEINEIYHKHFLDSMLGAKFIPENANVCDIGAGGGFPSIPLKILRPDLTFTLCDSRSKKINFLNMVIKTLHLDNTNAIHTRIEDLAHSKSRSSFDVVVSRGVAPLPTLLEYKMPLVKIGGIALCYKGDITCELESAQNAISILKCDKQRIEKFEISNDISHRNFLIVDKYVDNSKEYPRSKNQPRLNPL